MATEFDVADGVRSRIILASGRDVYLESMCQELTYRGLLEGIPVARINDIRVQAAINRARRQWVPGASPHLIPPVRRDYQREPGDMRDVKWPFGPPEFLPEVTTVALLTSVRPARDPAKDTSLLTVVWFQDDYGPPTGAVAEAVRALDWDTLAFDSEW